jgi:hypothetical protein
LTTTLRKFGKLTSTLRVPPETVFTRRPSDVDLVNLVRLMRLERRGFRATQARRSADWSAQASHPEARPTDALY